MGNAIEWQVIHERLTDLGNERAKRDGEEARWIAAGLRAEVHMRLGFATYPEYLERTLGHSRRDAQERVRVAVELTRLPVLREALEAGTLKWSAIKELTRVAVEETEAEWADAACGRSVREVERLVSGHRPGDRPSDPFDPSVVRHVLRFEVTAETLALFREANVKLMRDAGRSLGDDEVLGLLARMVLGGPSNEGRSGYRVQLSVCEECGRGWQNAGGEAVEVEPAAVASASCDEQRIEDRAHVGARVKQDVRPSVRRAVMARDGRRCRVPGCRISAWVDLHHITPQAEGGSHAADNLIVICGGHHRAIHRGELVIERVDGDVVFHHADGSPYGQVASPGHAIAFAEAFQGLVSSGFREREARAALERVQAKGVRADATAEDVLREAFRALKPLAGREQRRPRRGAHVGAA
jgi:hypothetical protein